MFTIKPDNPGMFGTELVRSKRMRLAINNL